jgi:uncharacterized protein YjbJ (UPF0337 family)
MGLHRFGYAWTELKTRAKQHWGHLPDDDFTEVERRRDRLARLIQERYGVGRDEADRQVDLWFGRDAGAATPAA